MTVAKKQKEDVLSLDEVAHLLAKTLRAHARTIYGSIYIGLKRRNLIHEIEPQEIISRVAIQLLEDNGKHRWARWRSEVPQAFILMKAKDAMNYEVKKRAKRSKILEENKVDASVYDEVVTPFDRTSASEELDNFLSLFDDGNRKIVAFLSISVGMSVPEISHFTNLTRNQVLAAKKHVDRKIVKMNEGNH
ncbi:MAG: hypothetical protein ABJN69_09755 [Hellea sp.]